MVLMREKKKMVEKGRKEWQREREVDI